MNCMNQSRGLQDVAARSSTNTIHSLTQLHETGRDTTVQTAPSEAACNKQTEQLNSCRNSKACAQDSFGSEAGTCVLVAVNAAKMNRHALEWALTNIVQPGDHIVLLALLPAGGRRLWSLALISGDCARRTVVRKRAKPNGKPVQDVEEEISEGCSCMMQELRSLCDSKKAKISIKVVAEGERGVIAMEADRIGASWVVLDKHVMKKEGKVCIEHLKCSVVMVKQSKRSKVLRLNLRGSTSARHDDRDLRLSSGILDTEITSLTKENWECELYQGNQPGPLQKKEAASHGRRERPAAPARLNRPSFKSTTERRITNDAEKIDFYNDGAASSESSCCSDAENATGAAHGACAPHLFSSDSETDSTTSRHLRYIAKAFSTDQLQVGSNEQVSHEYGYSDLDIVSSSCEHQLYSGHSGLLCTPATSPSPPNSLQQSQFELSIPVTCQQLLAHGKGERQELMFRDTWKPAPCMSKPSSANTTPKSDTLTLTGSSYPKPSRSPSPPNQHAPVGRLSNQHAPPPGCSGRVSRSPSPSKSKCTLPIAHNSVGVKLSSSSACSNPFFPATTTSATACASRSRSHLIPSPESSLTGTATSSSSWTSNTNTGSCRTDLVRHSRQTFQALVQNVNAGTCRTSGTGTSSSKSTVARVSDAEITTRELMQRFSEWDHQGSGKQKPSSSASNSNHRKDHANETELNDLERTSSVRRAMSMLGDGGVVRHVPAPAGPPPLCSICQHKSPVFGKPPRRFSYAELELATGGFSKANFLAEGGFGSVHRGVLPDGQAVAVKQHKLASSQGDSEFCSEVEVLSCAQHRNVVMLIGYCIEHCRRLLVYEFICNGSLDSHLYLGSTSGALSWAARQKVAVGAARGLRYLHEECRVGCIIHRDMRPNNILLTHDFEPMVGDFGLARWQPDGDLGVQTRVIGTFGYLAPEYAQSGEVTEKADVYSFGVVLLELVTGRKAVDLTRPKGQQCLTEWARPLLEGGSDMQQLIDPRMPEDEYGEYELFCALHAASLCIRRDPHLRPRMSQVLRILEGDVVIDHTSGASLSPSGFRTEAHLAAGDEARPCGGSYNGSRSGRISGEYTQKPGVVGGRSRSVSPPLISYSGSLLSSSSAADKRGVHIAHVAAARSVMEHPPADRLQYSSCGLAKALQMPTPSYNSTHIPNPYFSFHDL